MAKSQPKATNGHHKTRGHAASVNTFPGVSSHEIRRVAVAAMCDPRCVVKYLRGMPQPELVRLRVVAALESCDLGRLVGTPSERAERAANAATVRGAKT